MFKSNYLLCGVLALPGLVAAQTDNFPTKTLRILVPFPPGGSVDIISCMIAPKMGELMGQQIIVNNRAGENPARHHHATQ